MWEKQVCRGEICGADQSKATDTAFCFSIKENWCQWRFWGMCCRGRGWHQHVTNPRPRARWHWRLTDHKVGVAGHRSDHPWLHRRLSPVHSRASPCGRSQWCWKLQKSCLIMCQCLSGETLFSLQERDLGVTCILCTCKKTVFQAVQLETFSYLLKVLFFQCFECD